MEQTPPYESLAMALGSLSPDEMMKQENLVTFAMAKSKTDACFVRHIEHFLYF